VQWLEGPEEAVNEAWEQLPRDAGANRPMLLHRSRGPSALGEPVQIASLHAEKSSDVARRLHYIAREHEQGWAAEPVEVWQALSAPWPGGRQRFPGIRRPARGAGRGFDDNDAIELVRSVAQQAGARIAYQRYAGSELRRCDVGAAYADLAASLTTTVRVQGLSRRALSAGIRLLGLGHVERLVLLVGRERTRARAVLAETARLLRSLDHPPIIHVVSPCDATRELAADALQSLVAAHHFIVEASASAAATAASVLNALAHPSPESSGTQQESGCTPVAQS
jgi:hypothetical protein